MSTCICIRQTIHIHATPSVTIRHVCQFLQLRDLVQKRMSSFQWSLYPWNRWWDVVIEIYVCFGLVCTTRNINWPGSRTNWPNYSILSFCLSQIIEDIQIYRYQTTIHSANDCQESIKMLTWNSESRTWAHTTTHVNAFSITDFQIKYAYNNIHGYIHTTGSASNHIITWVHM